VALRGAQVALARELVAEQLCQRGLFAQEMEGW
jgi:hypothetical protein